MNQISPGRFQILPPVVKNLLIINGLFYLATVVLGESGNIDLSQYLGLHYFTSEYFQPFQIVTHLFMHGSLAHIFSNMFALWMFGSVLENFWGPKKFLIFYLICGVGAAFTHLAVTGYDIHNLREAAVAYSNHADPASFSLFIRNYVPAEYVTQFNAVYAQMRGIHSYEATQGSIHLVQDLVRVTENIPTVGASGAVFGVLLGFGMLFPNTYLFLLFPPIPIKAKYFVFFYGLFELWAGFTGASSDIAHFAHLGGMLFGFILIKFWDYQKRKKLFR